MSSPHLVVIGTSAGGLEALRTLAAALPAEFAAPICVVMHTAPQSPGILPGILARAGQLPAEAPKNLQRLEPGHIYVAPPDYHLLVEPGRLRVTKGPKENRFRPAIDPLFRSAAQVYGPLAIGVILTGNLDDGSAGLWAIKRLGGTAIVQDPDEALFPSMPRSAMQHTAVDYCVPLAEMSALLTRLVSGRPEETEVEVPDEMKVEVNIAKEQNAVDAGIERVGTPSSYACPECHGVLLQMEEGGRVRFRCHTGHAYSIDSLLAEVEEKIGDAMWNAVRALEEGGLLLGNMATHGGNGHDPAWHQHLQQRAAEARQQSEAIRGLVLQRKALSRSEG